MMNLAWRPIAIGTAALATVGMTLTISTPLAQASSRTYKITNYDHDGTHGVYLRNSASINNVDRNSAHYVTYGTQVELICYVSTGSSVGPYHNRMWDKVKVLNRANKGRTGYVSEHWLNTPVKTNQHVSGEPKCAKKPTTQAKAIAWARTKLGTTYDAGYCLRFVAAAYRKAGVNIGSEPSAVAYWRNDPRGYKRHSGNTHPSVGSLVFWGATTGKYANPYGHVGIYEGHDTVISTASWDPIAAHDNNVVHEWSFSARNKHGYPYLGWMLP